MVGEWSAHVSASKGSGDGGGSGDFSESAARTFSRSKPGPGSWSDHVARYNEDRGGGRTDDDEGASSRPARTFGNPAGRRPSFQEHTQNYAANQIAISTAKAERDAARAAEIQAKTNLSETKANARISTIQNRANVFTAQANAKMTKIDARNIALDAKLRELEIKKREKEYKSEHPGPIARIMNRITGKNQHPWEPGGGGGGGERSSGGGIKRIVERFHFSKKPKEQTDDKGSFTKEEIEQLQRVKDMKDEQTGGEQPKTVYREIQDRMENGKPQAETGETGRTDDDIEETVRSMQQAEVKNTQTAVAQTNQNLAAFAESQGDLGEDEPGPTDINQISLFADSGKTASSSPSSMSTSPSLSDIMEKPDVDSIDSPGLGDLADRGPDAGPSSADGGQGPIEGGPASEDA